MRNEEKKRMRSGGKGEGKWQENVRFYIHTAIMYNKLYTYVHEIFLSTTIITFNYNYSWNFFTVMRERRGLRAKEWLRIGSIWWRQPRFSVFGARRKYGAKTQVRATRAVKKRGGEKGGEKRLQTTKSKKLDIPWKIMRENSRKYIAQFHRRGNVASGKI